MRIGTLINPPQETNTHACYNTHVLGYLTDTDRRGNTLSSCSSSSRSSSHSSSHSFPELFFFFLPFVSTGLQRQASQAITLIVKPIFKAQELHKIM